MSQDLSSILESMALDFDDEASAEWDRKENEERIREKIKLTGIPKRYLDARIDDDLLNAWNRNPGFGILLQGDIGRGKTYTACALMIKMIREGKIENGMFVTCDGLFNGIKAEFGKREQGNLLSRACNTSLLILDDVGKERLTEWSQPILFQIINDRSNNMLPTIITTNYSGKDLIRKFVVDESDLVTAKAIISRISEYSKIRIGGPDRRLHEGELKYNS